MRLFVTQFRRDLLVAARSRSDAANPLAFFVLATVLLGLGAGAQLAPGVIWVLALFANVLAVEGVFRRDHDDGTLEQLLIHAQPLFPAVMGKLAAHWALSGLPVAVLSPVAAIMLTGTANGVGVLVGSTTTGGTVGATGGTVATTTGVGVGVSCSGTGVGDGVTRCGKVRTIPRLKDSPGGSGGACV